jgi:hypothetical protein
VPIDAAADEMLVRRGGTRMRERSFAARLADRQRHCHVYSNLDGSFHLLVVDDTGGFILVEQVDDPDAALWLCDIVNQALAAARRRRAQV